MDTNSITDSIIQTINSIFEKLFSSIDNNLYGILDNITFINSDILNDKNFENIFGTSATSGILLIGNSLLIAFLLYFSIKFLLSNLTYSQIEKPSQFIFKLIIFGIAMNFSFFILEQILSINSYISLSITSIGENLFNKNICFSELISSLNTYISVDSSSIDIFSLDGLIKGILTFSLLNLVFTYSFRYIMVKIFILLAPFAILSLSLNSSSWFFKAWIKNLFSLLFIQIIVAFVLVILFSMDYSSGNLLAKFLYVGGMYALIKANSFVRDFIGGVSTTFSQNVYNFKK